MNDLPSLFPMPGHLKPASRRHHRSSEESPTRQRISDDLLAHLARTSPVEALNGPLKGCLDTATASEQAFAIRAALASEKIREWLDELSEWPWPSGPPGFPTSAGFEMPTAKRRKVSGSGLLRPEEPAEDGHRYIGSLMAAELAEFERRLEEISQDMDELNVEEIKRHVLHNHIMPLSRPGTPTSDTRSVTSSMSSFARMDDLSAIVTAIVMQALPNLSKLVRSMNVWRARLAVLGGVPSLLDAISDAEIALRSGWNTISLQSRRTSEDTLMRNGSSENATSTDLTWNDFEVMKSVLERKIAKPGSVLDYMLDTVEGGEDTLPEAWLDRMEAVEEGYGEWAAACERKIREAEWAREARARISARPVSPKIEERVVETHAPEAVDGAQVPRLSTDDAPQHAEDGFENVSQTNLTSAQELISNEIDAAQYLQKSGSHNVLPVVDDDVKAVTLPVPINVERLFSKDDQARLIDTAATGETDGLGNKDPVGTNTNVTLPLSVNIQAQYSEEHEEPIETPATGHMHGLEIEELVTSRDTPIPVSNTTQPSCSEDDPEIPAEAAATRRLGVRESGETKLIENASPTQPTKSDIVQEGGPEEELPSESHNVHPHNGPEDTDTRPALQSTDSVDQRRVPDSRDNVSGVGQENEPKEDTHSIPSSEGIVSNSQQPVIESSNVDKASLPHESNGKTAYSLSHIETTASLQEEPCDEPAPPTPVSTMEEELSLPPLTNRTRRESSASETSIVVHGQSSHFLEASADGPEISGSPELPRLRDVQEMYRQETASPPSSPPVRLGKQRAASVTFSDTPTLVQTPDLEDIVPDSPLEVSFLDDDLEDNRSDTRSDIGSPRKGRTSAMDDQLQQQISEILESIPANIKLSSEPQTPNLNPPDLVLPRLKRPSKDPIRRSASSLSSRAPTPSFTLAPAYGKNPRPRHTRGNQEIKVYHLSRSTGEAPIKLFIRLVGENGERVMVRVGGGWADLGEYLKEYATHHGRRSAGGDPGKVEIRDLPRVATSRTNTGSSPPSRPASALDFAPMTPLNVRKTRKSFGPVDEPSPTSAPSSSKPPPKTPANPTVGTPQAPDNNTPSSGGSTRSRSSSRLSWTEEDSSLGLAGPTGKKVEMSEESRAWVESVKEKVRLASGERKVSGTDSIDGRFGEIGKVGGTKRLFRKG
jgi:hypothetical protein